MILVEISVLILSCCCTVAISAIQRGTKHGCLYDNRSRQCCSGYYAENKTCHECVGFFGVNCTSACPRGWFGKRCMQKCSCSNSSCDAVRGCLKVTALQLMAQPLVARPLVAQPLVAKEFPEQHKSSISNTSVPHDRYSKHSNPEMAQEMNGLDRPEIPPDKNQSFSYDIPLKILHDKNPGFPLDGNSDDLHNVTRRLTINNTNPGVPFVLSSQNSYTTASRPWNNLRDFIMSLQTKDWVIVCLVAFVLLIFTVFGVMKWRKVRKSMIKPEHISDKYFELGIQEPAVGSEYEYIEESVYTYVKYDRKHEIDGSSDADNDS